MKVKVIKYENYPVDDSMGYAVGFDVVLENGRNFYVDTLVEYVEIESGCIDEDIVNLAYSKVEALITEKADVLLYSKPSIVGIEFDLGNKNQIFDELSNKVINLETKVDDNTAVLDTLLGEV